MKIYNIPLILEGGGLRCAFTAGILEFFLDNSIEFSHIYGVSAGASVAASYLAKQKGRNCRINVDMPSDPRFLGVCNFFRERSFFGMKYLYDEVPNHIDPFDFKTFFETKTRFFTVVTSLQSGLPEYIENSRHDKQFSMKLLAASGSIPLLSPPVKLDGKFYYDGGVSDSIPVKKALQQHDKAVVVLTRLRGYRKKSQKFKKYLRFRFRKYPEFVDVMLSRSDHYNSTLDYIDDMERKGKVLVIAPEDAAIMVERMERRRDKLKAFYDHGYDIINRRINDLDKFSL
ncbi:MAG TPA: patatin family protein [Spirochaetota bacterium]|nr:patatin family protein [Spirochaetota bacterium]